MLSRQEAERIADAICDDLDIAIGSTVFKRCIVKHLCPPAKLEWKHGHDDVGDYWSCFVDGRVDVYVVRMTQDGLFHFCNWNRCKEKHQQQYQTLAEAKAAAQAHADQAGRRA